MARSPLKDVGIDLGVGLGELTDMLTGLSPGGSSLRGQPPSNGITPSKARAMTVLGWERRRPRLLLAQHCGSGSRGQARTPALPAILCSLIELRFIYSAIVL